MGGAHPVAPRNVSLTGSVYLHRPGRGHDQLLPEPTTRSRLDTCGGEPLCSPLMSTYVSVGGLDHAVQRHRAPHPPRPGPARGTPRYRGAAGDASTPDRAAAWGEEPSRWTRS